VKRECFLYKSSTIYNKHIYVDKGNAKDILKIIKEDQVKFNRIKLRILETDHHYYPKYEKLKNYDGLTEMRFLGNPNARIYCKEFKAKDGRFIILMGKSKQYKKSDDINKVIKEQLKVLQKYEYDI